MLLLLLLLLSLINLTLTSIQRSASSLPEQDRIIHYEWEEDEDGKRVRLGKGSFGTVYSAIDEDTKLMVQSLSLPALTPPPHLCALPLLPFARLL